MGLFKLLQSDAMFRKKKLDEGHYPSRAIKDIRDLKKHQRTGRFPEKEVESQFPLHPLPHNYFRMQDISIIQLQ